MLANLTHAKTSKNAYILDSKIFIVIILSVIAYLFNKEKNKKSLIFYDR